MSMSEKHLHPVVCGVLVVLWLAVCAHEARAQLAGKVPEDLEGVGVVEHREAKLPLDLTFTDDLGREVRLGDYFNQDKPVVLTLNYLSCPMLCTLQLNGLVDVMKELDWTPGQEFEVVTLSFDPTETYRLAREKKQNYIKSYDRPEGAAGWHFLVGEPSPVKQLTEAVGFTYRWNEERQEWAHAAVAVVCTPDGRISRYLYGLMYEEKTVRLSLVEASEGRIGSPLDQIILYCFHYDADAGRYAPVARNIMRAGGALTMLLLGSTLGMLWWRDARRRATQIKEAES
jgi:protein SCO1/2